MKQGMQSVPVREIRLGRDASFEAWLSSMMMDNNLVHAMNPELIAPPEQLRFMVQMDEDQVYLPCSDEVFQLLRQGHSQPALQKLYNRAWRLTVQLLREHVPDKKERIRIFHLCRYRFIRQIRCETLLPSRLIKRMTTMLLSQARLADDPWLEGRRAENLRAHEFFARPEIKQSLEVMPNMLPRTMRRARRLLNSLELVRLMCCAAMAGEWAGHTSPASAIPAAPDAHMVARVMQGAAQSAVPLMRYFERCSQRSTTVLYICGAEGGIYADLVMLRSLLRMGHKVICAVKSGCYFNAPTVDDMESDATLVSLLQGAAVVQDPRLSKNELLRRLREHRFLVIADGTRERLNLHRVSVTFARAWKEADVVLAKGARNAEILLGTSHEFTRDVICFWLEQGNVRIRMRPHALTARKCNEEDIAAHADTIIASMRAATAAGRSVMFYSCVIGSIPGETATAINLARTFVDNLRKKMDNILIINPAEHFVEGMDGDDLMYMWERVQRSGYINVWRFQTVEDIEESFTILGCKVPPIWSGKDSTYSTGCTKEMRIALDVQSHNREMQLIGPEPRLFFRRGEYGVGKYFDADISRSHQR